jgi:hypothetical protein
MRDKENLNISNENAKEEKTKCRRGVRNLKTVFPLCEGKNVKHRINLGNMIKIFSTRILSLGQT